MSKVFALNVVGGNVKALVGAIDTIQNVTVTTDKWGQERGLEFSGNSYIKLVDDPLRNFGTDVDFTISVWFKYGSGVGGGYDAILGHPKDYTSLMSREASKPTPYATFIPIPTNGNWTTCRYGKAISTTDWHHFALVRKDTTATYYIDGVGTNFNVTNNKYDIENLYIGWDGRQSNAWLKGVISDLVIYRDEVLWTEDFTPPTHPLLGASQLYLDSNNAVWGCKP